MSGTSLLLDYLELREKLDDLGDEDSDAAEELLCCLDRLWYQLTEPERSILSAGRYDGLL